MLRATTRAVSGLTALLQRRKVSQMAVGQRWCTPLLGLALACDDGSLPAGPAASALPWGDPATTNAAPPGAAAPLCPGAGCSVLALAPALDPTDPFRQRIVVRGDSSLAPRFRSDTRCASLGPDVAYDLDLRAFPAPVRVYLGLHASFDGSLRIERGPEEDPFVVSCNEDHVPGINDAFLAVTLLPERYRVVADGEQPEDGGPFELSVEIPSRDGLCWQAPLNDRCEQAIPVDLTGGPQVFVGTTECASDQADPLWECGSFADRGGEVLYALDLSDRTTAVRLHATTDVEPKGADTTLFVVRGEGDCAETLLCNQDASEELSSSELWARLEPGHYLLAVEGYEGTPVDFGLEVAIDPEPCVVSNDTCRTAEAIAPRVGRQSLTVWPMCGDDTIRTECELLGPSPDIFYRLDLSQFQGRVHVRAHTERAGARFGSLVLLANAGETCGAELWCGDFDLWLEPESYYLALDGFRDQQGPVQFEIEIETAAAPPIVDCIDEKLAQCAFEQGCCLGDDSECWLVYLSCGLAREALDCLCAAEPACCDGRGGSDECGTLLQGCGTFCPSFDPLVSCPE
jgi:hypothetical protein